MSTHQRIAEHTSMSNSESRRTIMRGSLPLTFLLFSGSPEGQLSAQVLDRQNLHKTYEDCKNFTGRIWTLSLIRTRDSDAVTILEELNLEDLVRLRLYLEQEQISRTYHKSSRGSLSQTMDTSSGKLTNDKPSG